MNTYTKYCPNVYCAKCENEYKHGDIINVTTKYGKENECLVFNLLLVKDGFWYYSIVRTDGYNHAQARADRLNGYAANAEKRSTAYWEASHEGRDFLALAEPIKVGHHSEKRHRALIERNHARMDKSVAEQDKAVRLSDKAAYWEAKAGKIDLSMPDSVEYFTVKLEQAEAKQRGLKDGTLPREHSYSLAYATKDVKEARKNLDLAIKLWG